MDRDRYASLSERKLIAEYIRQNPDATLKMIGKKFGRSYVLIWRVQQAMLRGDPSLGAKGVFEYRIEIRERIIEAHLACPYKSYTQIGRELDTSAQYVKRVLKRNGLERKYRRKHESISE